MLDLMWQQVELLLDLDSFPFTLTALVFCITMTFPDSHICIRISCQLDSILLLISSSIMVCSSFNISPLANTNGIVRHNSLHLLILSPSPLAIAIIVGLVFYSPRLSAITIIVRHVLCLFLH